MKTLLFVVSILLSSLVMGQTTEDSVKQVINEFFSALKEGDGKAIREFMADSATLQTIANKNGRTQVRNEELDLFINSINQLAFGDADEQITFASILVDGELASAWTPYKFYYKGSFSHCGVNSFHLVRMADRWKIISIVDTRRKSNCP
jgi:ketosteroid isomerase-like protein